MTAHLTRRLLAWACVAAALLAAVSVLLYAHAQTFDEKDYFEDVVALRRIKELDAQLDMAAVKSHMQGDMDYGSLAKALDEMRRLADDTDEDAHTERYAQAQELASARRALVQAVGDKSGSIGRLKSSVLALQNARDAVLSAADALQAHGGPPRLQSPAAMTMRARARKLTAATMLPVQADTGAGTAASLLKLSRLEQDATELPTAQRLLFLQFSDRMRIFLRAQHADTAMLASITGAAVGARADAVNNLLNQEQERYQTDTHVLRDQLVVLASALALLLIYFSAKLVLSNREIARVNEALEAANESLEQRVQQRTRELHAAQDELVATARRAGMAEIATTVLHTVGNILNSVNTSASLIRKKVHGSRIAGIARISGMLDAHADNLGQFLTLDPKGQLLPGYLRTLAESLALEQQEVIRELDHLAESVEHINNVVATQQSHAGNSTMTETVHVDRLVEEALRISAATLGRLNVVVVPAHASVGTAQLDKTGVLQILLNLISNGAQAMEQVNDRPRLLTVRVEDVSPGLRISVRDDGVGIAPENLTRIFSHGFTARASGHGSDLHSCALTAQQMGGRLSATSEGAGRGATFTLELPVEARA